MNHEKFKPMDAIAYIPIHANGDITHQDVEFGFVTTVEDDRVFCRYWAKGEIGTRLRTTSCSECTPIDRLRKHKSTTIEKISAAWRKFLEGK